jgi:hypothetical protein
MILSFFYRYLIVNWKMNRGLKKKRVQNLPFLRKQISTGPALVNELSRNILSLHVTKKCI